MIVNAPQWNGPGLGDVMGPTDIGTVDPVTGIPISSTVDSLQQQLASLPLNQLSSVLNPFLASGTSVYGVSATPAISPTRLAIVAGVFLLLLIAGGRR